MSEKTNTVTVEPTAGSAACYDIENRPTCSTPYTYAIGYAPDNKRIWEGGAYNDPGTGHDYSEDRFTLFGIDGQRVGIYRIRNRMSPPDTINMRFVTMEENVWVGKKLLKTRKGTTTEVVLQDRLGSVLFRYNANTDAKKAYAYYPYGQSRRVNTPYAEEGFGTYTLLDGAENYYADQRYYNANNGRFHQPDPYQASGGPTNPLSWNRYTYVEGDPINYNDPTGLNLAHMVPLEGGSGWFWGGIGTYDYWNGEYWQTYYGPVAFAMQSALVGDSNPGRSVDPRQLMSDRLKTFDEGNCAKVFGDLGIDIATYKARAGSSKLLDLRPEKMQERTISSVVGGRDVKTLGESLGGADAAVVRGPSGTAILLGAEFYGVNLDKLTPAEWTTFQRHRGSIMLHESLHVYSPLYTDSYIFSNWAQEMFVDGKVPEWGGSRWISIWIDNDCQKIDTSKPGVFW